MKKDRCLFCNGSLRLVISFGNQPIVNYFPTKKELTLEKTFPLRFTRCTRCELLQLSPILSPEKMFTDYHYVSGASTPLAKHLSNLASELDTTIIKKGDCVVDIGCNDLSFLKSLPRGKYTLLGIDPSPITKQASKKLGIPIIHEFFTRLLARKLREQSKSVNCIVVTHTLANIPNLHDFFEGIYELLSDDGTLLLEVGSVEAMIKKRQFDAIYHEHYTYFSKRSIKNVLQQFGFTISKMEANNFHGGSLRVYARKVQSSKIKNQKHSAKVKSYKKQNSEFDLEEYHKFAEGIKKYRKEFRELFAKIKGKKIVGFGAPAKGVTLLNYCAVGPHEVSYIVDSTPYKQARFMPGVHIPIFKEEVLWKDNPDYILLLAWNYTDEIVDKIRKNLSKKTKIIIPFPKLSIV